MKEKIKIGYIGVGRRGMSVLNIGFSKMCDVEVSVICDLSQKRLERARDIVMENGGYEPRLTTNYKDVISDPSLDAIVIMIGWSGRPQMAMEAMRAGKYTAIEVGCADSLEECYDLIRTYEKTGAPLMMLENACYCRRELMALNMAEQGLLGELVHCTGGYHHYLNDVELFRDIDTDDIPHYRLCHYEKKNRENYPTHEFGPISKILGINRKNRIVSLASFASKAVGIKSYAAERFGKDSEYAKADYAQGDIVTTVLTCENGETVMLTLDTTLPRAYYSRNFSVRGTKGMIGEERRVTFLEGMKEEIENNDDEMYLKYDHPIYKEYSAQGIGKEGHGGVDWLICRALVESVKRGENTPIDAYDTVTWMAIGPLSELSIAENRSVEFPDFTNGKWRNREPIVKGKYCLDAVCDEPNTPIFPKKM